MRFRIFTVPIGDPESCQDLNGFLAGHRVLSVQRELVQNGGGSCWAFCVEYLENRVEGRGVRARKERIDYKQTLPPDQFEVFSRLRDCRKELATKEGLPAFAVCTDEQLATMAKAVELTPTVLGGIEGFGEAKTAKYGAALTAAHANPGAPA